MGRGGHARQAKRSLNVLVEFFGDQTGQARWRGPFEGLDGSFLHDVANESISASRFFEHEVRIITGAGTIVEKGGGDVAS